MSPEAYSLLEPTFTVADLCGRYHCGKSRLYSLIAEHRDFPAGVKLGRHRAWSAANILAWEKVHLPQFHTQVEETHADDEWDQLREVIAQQQAQPAPAARRPAKKKPAPPRRHR